MQNVRHTAQNAGHTTQNDGRIMQNVIRTRQLAATKLIFIKCQEPILEKTLMSRNDF